MKGTTDIQPNVKLLHLLNEKVICLTLTEKKIYKFAPKLDVATLAGSRVYGKITPGFRTNLGTVNT